MDPVLFFDSPLSMETNLVLFGEDLVFSFKAWVLILEREDKLSVRTSNCHGSLYLTILYVKPTGGRLPSSGFLSLLNIIHLLILSPEPFQVLSYLKKHSLATSFLTP